MLLLVPVLQRTEQTHAPLYMHEFVLLHLTAIRPIRNVQPVEPLGKETSSLDGEKEKGLAG